MNSWGVRVLGNKLHQFGHQQTVTYELSDADIDDLCLSIKNNLVAKLKDDSVQIDPAPKVVAPMGLGTLPGSNPQATSSPTGTVSQPGPRFIPLGFNVTNTASKLGQTSKSSQGLYECREDHQY